MAGESVLAKLAVLITANSAQFTKELSKTNASIQNFVGGLKAIGGALAVKELISSVTEVTAKYQKFQAVLTNTLGSRSQALSKLDEITNFAARTPFQVDELTSSFVKLANQGFKPTINELTSLGDLAASTGKGFDQLTEAIIDAQTGEFERLKEFGIRAQKEGDKVKFTFKGVQTQVDFTSESIRNYILGLGNAVGVSGSMAAISETVGGKISNFKDNVDQIIKGIGDRSSGLISGILDLANGALGALSGALNDQVPKLQKEQAELNVLVGAITDVNVPTEVRAKLLSELNSKYPDFLRNLNVETVTNEQLSERLKDVNDQFVRKIALASAEKRLSSIQDRILDLIDEEADARKDLNKIKQEEERVTVSNLGVTGDKANRILFVEARVLAAQNKRLALQKEVTDRLTEYTRALDLFNSKNNDYFETNEKIDKQLKKSASFKPPVIPIKFDFQPIDEFALLKAFREHEAGLTIPVDVEIEPETVNDDALTDALREKIEGLKQLQEAFSATFQGGIQDVLTGFAEDLGNAASGVGNFGENIIKAVAGFAAQFGKLLIVAGLGKIAFDKLKFSGVGAVFAGIALIAAAKAVSNHISASSSATSGGGSVSSSSVNNRPSASDQVATIQIVGESRIQGDMIVTAYNRARSNRSSIIPNG